MQNDLVDNLRLDINKHRVKACVYVRVGDTRTRTLHITIADNGTVYDLTNLLIAELLIKKADGTETDQSMIRYGNELHYTLRTQDVSAEGEAKCQVRLTFTDGAVLTSPEFSLMCYETEANDDGLRSTNEYTAISQMLAQSYQYVGEAQESAEKAEEYELLCSNHENNAKESVDEVRENIGQFESDINNLKRNVNTINSQIADNGLGGNTLADWYTGGFESIFDPCSYNKISRSINDIIRDIQSSLIKKITINGREPLVGVNSDPAKGTEYIFSFEFPITVDSSLSTTSTHPIQNQAVANALNLKQDVSTAITTSNIASQSVASAETATKDSTGTNIATQFADCLKMPYTTITSGDLGDKVSNGTYRWSDDDAANIAGKPFDGGGILFVTNNDGFYLQICTKISTNGIETEYKDFYARYILYGHNWTSWKRVATSDDVSSLGTSIATKEDLLGKNQLPSTVTDFNDLKTNGIYRLSGAQATGGVANVPIASVGTIIVLSTAETVTQIYHRGSNGEVYMRICWWGTWGDWKKIATSGYSTVSDCNNATEINTVYYGNNNTANMPVSNSYMFITAYKLSSTIITQMAYQVNSQSDYVWTRRCVNGTWQSWVRLVTLNDINATSTTTVTDSTSGVTCQFTKKGSICVATIIAPTKITSQIATDGTLVTIPEGYRPYCRVETAVTGGSNGACLRAFAQGSKIGAGQVMAQNLSIRGSFTYPLA